MITTPYPHTNQAARPHILLSLTLLSLALLSACHMPIYKTATPQAKQTPSTNFAITGKIGISTQGETGRQGGSAFYAWRQEGERFAIDLTGALGLGATSIRYNGMHATLTSQETGTISANDPATLFYKATGWQAPILNLRHWVMGKNAPGDTNSIFIQGKLTQTQNGDWHARFNYSSASLPSSLIITHRLGHRVVLSINGR